MDQQNTSVISTEQGSRPAQGVSDRTWADLRTGITLIAWFAMYTTFYSLTRSVISLLDTNYSMAESGRLFIAVGVAALLSTFILGLAKGAQD